MEPNRNRDPSSALARGLAGLSLALGVAGLLAAISWSRRNARAAAGFAYDYSDRSGFDRPVALVRGIAVGEGVGEGAF